MLTPEQTRRIREAIRECDAFIAKERRYPEHLQKPAEIAWYQQHQDRLNRMLREQRVILPTEA